MKERRTSPRSSDSPGGRPLGLEAAATWKVFECLVSPWWRDTTKLTEILVAKEPPFGGVVTCMFIVDLGCLGPKQAFVSQFRTKLLYETEFRSVITARNPMVATAYSLGAKIIRKSIRYADSLGFGRFEGVQETLSALGPLQVGDACEETIPLGGPDGKPFYMAGPDDDVDHIMNTLIRMCGHGNFQFIAPFGSMPGPLFD